MVRHTLNILQQMLTILGHYALKGLLALLQKQILAVKRSIIAQITKNQLAPIL